MDRLRHISAVNRQLNFVIVAFGAWCVLFAFLQLVTTEFNAVVAATAIVGSLGGAYLVGNHTHFFRRL